MKLIQTMAKYIKKMKHKKRNNHQDTSVNVITVDEIDTDLYVPSECARWNPYYKRPMWVSIQ